MVSKAHPEKYLNILNEKYAKKIGKVDVYKTAHHGQDDSTNASVLKFLQPKFYVITNFEDYSKTFKWLQNVDKSKIFCTEKKSWLIDIKSREFYIK